MTTLSNTNTHQESKTETPRKSAVSQNFLVRYITAIILIPIGLFGMFVGGIVWTTMMAIMMLFGGMEFYAMSHGRPRQGHMMIGLMMMAAVLAGFHLQMPAIWLIAVPLGLVAVYIYETINQADRYPIWCTWRTLVGVIYVGLPAAFLVGLRQFESGFMWLIIVFAITWGTDTFAYFGGRAFGKRKLAPELSPNKTVEGAVVGVIGGLLLALAFVIAADLFSIWTLIMVIIAPFLGVLGDLIESAMKRFYKIKDSHIAGLNVIPGHGGVLDRIDALITVTLFCYPLVVLTGVAA